MVVVGVSTTNWLVIESSLVSRTEQTIYLLQQLDSLDSNHGKRGQP